MSWITEKIRQERRKICTVFLEKKNHTIKGDLGSTEMIKLLEKKVKIVMVRNEPLTHLMT